MLQKLKELKQQAKPVRIISKYREYEGLIKKILINTDNTKQPDSLIISVDTEDNCEQILMTDVEVIYPAHLHDTIASNAFNISLSQFLKVVWFGELEETNKYLKIGNDRYTVTLKKNLPMSLLNNFLDNKCLLTFPSLDDFLNFCAELEGHDGDIRYVDGPGTKTKENCYIDDKHCLQYCMQSNTVRFLHPSDVCDYKVAVWQGWGKVYENEDR